MPFAASPKSDLLLKALDAIEALDAFEVLEVIDILEVTLPGLFSRLDFWFLLGLNSTPISTSLHLSVYKIIKIKHQTEKEPVLIIKKNCNGSIRNNMKRTV